MPNIADFTLKDMVDFSAALRSMGSGAVAMEDAAERIVQHLYENLIDEKSGDKNCVLVRFFLTRRYDELDREQKDVVDRALDGLPGSPSMKCLALLATLGSVPEWNSPKTSRAHRVIPLPSVHFVEDVPMVADIIRQMGLDIATLLQQAHPAVMEMAKTTYNVACVPDAVGNKNIPAQNDFVIPYGVRSEIGLGGILPSGNLFVIIIFSRVPVTRQAADMFRPLTLSVKVAVLPFDRESSPQPGVAGRERGDTMSDSHVTAERVRKLEATASALAELGRVQEGIVAEQSELILMNEIALKESNDRFLAFIKEAAMRLKNPMEVVEENLGTLIGDLEVGQFNPGDASLQLKIQLKNLEQIRQNIIELNKMIVKRSDDLSEGSKRFLTE